MTRYTNYTAKSPLSNPEQFFREARCDLGRAISIGWQLFQQNFAARYSYSFLGYLWILIPPFALMATTYLMHSAKIIQYSSTDIPYPIFVLCGTLIWQLFSESLQGIINLISSKRTLLTRIPFPRESLIVAQLIESHFTLCVLAIPIAILVFAFNLELNSSALLSIFFLSAIIILGTLLGAIIAPLALLIEDVKRLTTIFLTFLFLVTPVAYQAPKSSLLGDIINLNPLSSLITTTRDLLFGLNQQIAPASLFISLASIFLLIIAWLSFRLAAPIALERAGTIS